MQQDVGRRSSKRTGMAGRACSCMARLDAIPLTGMGTLPRQALQPAVCSHGSRLQRSPRMDVSPPAAQASAFLFLHPSCPSVPWLLSPRYTPHHLQRDRACCTHSSRSPHQDTEASASPAPIATVKASPQATTVTFMARSPTTRWGTRLLRQELVPSCPCWLLPKV